MRPSHAAPGELAGTGTLIRFYLRRDRVKLPAWIAGLAAFAIYITSALPQIAPTKPELQSAVSLLAQPVGRMFTGPGYGLESATYARMFVGGYGLYFVIIAALMNVFLVVRHTRLEEQTGRAELVRANVVGRHSALTAVLVVAVGTNTVAAVLVAVIMLAAGYGAAGTVLFAASVAAAGMSFAGIAAITAQISEFSRGASGLAGGVIALAFIVRMVGDMPDEGGSIVSWFSPLAWAQQAAPFVRDRWWVLILPVVLSCATVVGGYILQARRDLDASWMAARPGRAHATRWLSSTWGLGVRVQRATVIGWLLAVVVAAVVDGAYTQTVIDAGASLPDTMKQVLGDQGMVAGYVSYISNFSVYLTIAFVVSSMQIMQRDEAHGRAEIVLSTPVRRTSWMGSHVAVAAAGLIVIMLLAGLAAGLAAAIVTGDWSTFGDLFLAHANLIPAVTLVLGVAAFLFGLIPRIMAAVSWAYVALIIFLSIFGPMLDIPGPLTRLSPLSHLAAYPVESYQGNPVIMVLVLSGLLTTIGLIGFTRRQVKTGS